MIVASTSSTPPDLKAAAPPRRGAQGPPSLRAPGAEADVAAAWTETLGDRALVLPRAEAIARGYFGPVDPRVLGRIGDVIAVCTDGFAVVDSQTESASALALIGHHGATTDAELRIPLLVV